MQIQNSRLILEEGSTHDLKWIPLGGWAPIINPRVLVIHYGVTSNIDSLVAAQRASGYRAHLSIDGFSGGKHGSTYQLRQHVEFNRKATHAGLSHWNGVDSVNEISVGVEIANPGPLTERNGKLYTVYNQEWPRDDAVELRHEIPTCPYKWWANYSDQEVDILVTLAHLFARELGFVDVVGHDEIATPRGRKIDPGPAMPMRWLRNHVYGREHMLGQAA